MPFSAIGSTVATGLEESLIRDLAADPGGADRESEEVKEVLKPKPGTSFGFKACEFSGESMHSRRMAIL